MTEKLTEDECRAALRAYGMDPLEIQALFDLALTDPTVHACVTMWRLGERTLPKTLTQLVLHLGKEKAAYLRQATKAAEGPVAVYFCGPSNQKCKCEGWPVRAQVGWAWVRVRAFERGLMLPVRVGGDPAQPVVRAVTTEATIVGEVLARVPVLPWVMDNHQVHIKCLFHEGFELQDIVDLMLLTEEVCPTLAEDVALAAMAKIYSRVRNRNGVACEDGRP